MQLLMESEVVQLLKRILKGRRVKIVTERDFAVSLSERGEVIPVIRNEALFKHTSNVSYIIRPRFLLPGFIILLMDLKKGKRVRRHALIFLPQYFKLLELIGTTSALGFIDGKSDDVHIIEINFTFEELSLLGMISSLSALYPEISEFHQARSLELLSSAFPQADWLVEYYTKDAQVTGDSYD